MSKNKQPEEIELFNVTLTKDRHMKIHGDTYVMSDPLKFMELFQNVLGAMREHYMMIIEKNKSKIIKPETTLKIVKH